MRRTPHLRHVSSSRSFSKSCFPSWVRRTSSRASRTPSCRTVSLESSLLTQTTRARPASRSTSSPQSAWVCSQRACANGSRTPHQNPSHSPSQKATATIRAASRATLPIPHAATRAPAVEAGHDHAHPHDVAKTPARDLAPRPEEGATLAAQHQTANALPAKAARGHPQTRDRAPALRRRANAITRPAAHRVDPVRRHPSAAGAVRQIRCLEARRRREEAGVPALV